MRTFVTHILPKDKILRYHLSVAACNFSYNLIEGGVFDRFYSTLPTYVHGDLSDVDMKELIYSSWRRRSGWSRWAPFWECLAIYRKIPNEGSVWLYNVSILNSFLMVLLRVFRRSVGVYVILLDYTPTRNLIQRFFLWQANHSDGMIHLANSPLFTNPNKVCLPGVTPLVVDRVPEQQTLNREFLISGVLDERIAMLSMLLSAFSQMPHLILHITGSVNRDDLRVKYGHCKNIIFHGQLPYNEYLQVFHHVSFQLSTRNPQCEENLCNFPSKVMEALLHNRIVLSTIHYEQLEGIRYFEVASEEHGFMQDVKRIANMTDNDLLQYANQGKTVAKRFNTRVWEQKMEEIEKLRI